MVCKQVDFDIQTKEFVIRAGTKMQTSPKSMKEHVEYFSITHKAFCAVMTPHQHLIADFFKKINSSQNSIDPVLKLTVSLAAFPEKILIVLAQLWKKLQGNTVILTAIGAEDYIFPIKKFLTFYDMIGAIKELWSLCFDIDFINYCKRNRIRMENLLFEVSIQRWPKYSKKVYRVKLDADFRVVNRVNMRQIATIRDLVKDHKCKIFDFIKTKGGQYINFREVNIVSHKKPYSSQLLLFKDKEFARISVVGIVLFKGRFLMLKQTDDNQLWRPPCGGVHKGEDLVDALVREIKEDTGLDVDVILPVSVWKGAHGIDQTTISITYVCNAPSGNVKISSEYTQFSWFNVSELKKLPTQFDTSNWKKYTTLANLSKNIID
jgi:8-oxo-dGTP diphosphatase